MDSKLLLSGAAAGFAPPTAKSRILLIATAGTLPERIRGKAVPTATARKGAGFVATEFSCRQRLSQPSSVDLTPGVPDSM